MLGLTLLILLAAALVAWARYQTFASRGLVGVDLTLFSELGRRWVETGSQYAAFQFAPFSYEQGAGGTDVSVMPGLYPPLAGPVFAVVRLLPPILWWAPVVLVPLLLRPRPWAWPLIALCLAWPATSASIIAGNTTMWITLLVALGLRYRWPAALILLKPTLAPLALVGIRSRWWWVALGVMGALTLAMLPELLRYFEVLRNVRGGSVLYSLGDLPMLLIPVVSRGSRSR